MCVEAVAKPRRTHDREHEQRPDDGEAGDREIPGGRPGDAGVDDNGDRPQ